MSETLAPPVTDFITTHFITSQHLPVVIEPKDPDIRLPDFLTLLREGQNLFHKHLSTIGGILFRNFPIHSAADFEAVVTAMNIGSCVDYIGGDSPRVKVHNQIYTSTEAPPSIPIPLHNELSFVDNWPSHICFYCDIAPEDRGETPIGDARKIYEAIDPKIREKFIEKGLKYVSRYHHNSRFFRFMTKRSHKSWTEVFETDSKEEVEGLCRENNFQFKWNQNDWLEVSQIRPVVMAHPQTGEMTWFNQCHLYDFNPRYIGKLNHPLAKLLYIRKHTRFHEVFFGDGSPIPRKDIYHILHVLDQQAVKFPWRKGDVAIYDNVLTMHARAPFSGKRRILTCLTKSSESPSA